jgi:hypothetical protein
VPDGDFSAATWTEPCPGLALTDSVSVDIFGHSTTAYPLSCSWASARAGHDSRARPSWDGILEPDVVGGVVRLRDALDARNESLRKKPLIARRFAAIHFAWG